VAWIDLAAGKKSATGNRAATVFEKFLQDYGIGIENAL
jgi:hypothetical protein